MKIDGWFNTLLVKLVSATTIENTNLLIIGQLLTNTKMTAFKDNQFEPKQILREL